MSVGEQLKKNLEKNDKQTANEKQTTKSHGTTNMETSEIQQTLNLEWRDIFFIWNNFNAPIAFSTLFPSIYVGTTLIQFWTNYVRVAVHRNKFLYNKTN